MGGIGGVSAGCAEIVAARETDRKASVAAPAN
jgi:hypothetical protein